jgi:hypothetical protein
MPIDDESALRRTPNDPDSGSTDTGPLVARIKRLVTTQPYAVLCTHGDDQAYGSLVAFAFSEDLRTAVFSTPIATRKYRLLSEHDRVALVVDDRPEWPNDMMRVEAITATGRAREITESPLLDRCSRLLVARHPHLRSFVAADSSALFQIEITRFLHVSRFQEVNQWVPDNPS